MGDVRDCDFMQNSLEERFEEFELLRSHLGSKQRAENYEQTLSGPVTRV